MIKPTSSLAQEAYARRVRNCVHGIVVAVLLTLAALGFIVAGIYARTLESAPGDAAKQQAVGEPPRQ